MIFPSTSSPYVYIFRDESKQDAAGNPEAFYVGKCEHKTEKDRAFDHLKRSHNKHLGNKVQKAHRLGNLIIEIWDVPEGESAIELEKFLIDFIGRKDLGLGSLLNLTDGGDGMSGHKHKPETLIKMSAIHRGKKLSEDHVRLMKEAYARPEVKAKRSAWQNIFLKGKKRTEEQKTNISNGLKGKKRTEEQKTNISNALKNNNSACAARCSCITCHQEMNVPNLSRWHKDCAVVLGTVEN